MLATGETTEVLHQRWEALKRREKDVDGTFVYAVITTGVYCRAACPSRLPKFENVRFYATNAEAVRAGFRACKRCKPDEVQEGKAKADAIAKACKAIEEADGAPDYDAVAAVAGMSRHHFHRTFKAAMGMTPGAYLRTVRERRVVGDLSRGTGVTKAIYGAGYSSSSRFYETIAPKLGLKASALSKGGAGETIRFAAGQCSIGHILVAATANGICAIEFGDDADTLVEGFQKRFANAELAGGDPDFDRMIAMAVGFVDTPQHGLDLPLDVRGTAFQHRVWQALRDIPMGTTMTYAEVAAKIGQPKAVRAVANACANNKIAVAIPCHRVVRTGGALSGYRWGIERKAALIEKEARP